VTPTLLTERLILHPYTASKVVDRHVEWLNNSETTRYSEQRHTIHTLESQHTYLNKFPAGSAIWLITVNITNIDIGSITAFVDSANRIADMGILIGESSVMGQAYGLEAWVEVMRFLFKSGIRKVECGCMSRNTPMRLLAARCDMTLEGIRRDHFILDGKPDDLVQFGKYA
jgi:[ribosomal protein S5]-alanine N-acetyltransferase